MHTEIERRFLVTPGAVKEKDLADKAEKIEVIKQGYLNCQADGLIIRVRTAETTKNIHGLPGKTACLIIKSKPLTKASRIEMDYAIPLDDAEYLMSQTGAVIDKIRYTVWEGNHCFEVDVFQGRHSGIIMAEVELNAEDEWVNVPTWCGKEITGDTRYSNYSMAKTEGAFDAHWFVLDKEAYRLYCDPAKQSCRSHADLLGEFLKNQSKGN